ncbi:hypothetical protein [Flavobacterium columnare]|uniref:Uncharacterized protein n=2 Tax=Flavobacterium TaxID=237 RepID=A0ABW8PLF0_9FLAO|nr:hypothetical protein [Flavobacterium columnare]SPE77134.1 hypothetical protein FLACOL_01124 [Flavobacterium columnare]
MKANKKEIVNKKDEDFEIGDIVAIKSHPLFRDHNKIIEFPAQTSPLMLVKEIFYEDEHKKKTHSEESGNKIASLEKCTCVYFNANKSEFVEVTIYSDLLKKYNDLKYYRKVKENNENIDLTLIDEVKSYVLADYNYGEVVQFKTKKLEHRKSYQDNNEKISNISFQTPDFVLSGIKEENNKDLFYSNGNIKRKVSNVLFKVMWFNHYQQKFSEQYLPKEFFVEKFFGFRNEDFLNNVARTGAEIGDEMQKELKDENLLSKN